MKKKAFSGLVGSGVFSQVDRVEEDRKRKLEEKAERESGSFREFASQFAEDKWQEGPTEGPTAPAEESNTALYVGLGLVAILAAAWALSSKKG